MIYKVRKTGNAYDLYEVGTSLKIELGTSEKRARALRERGNKGSGFAGWTPTFFATRFPLENHQDCVQ